jgi:hypothetical protein
VGGERKEKAVAEILTYSGSAPIRKNKVHIAHTAISQRRVKGLVTVGYILSMKYPIALFI